MKLPDPILLGLLLAAGCEGLSSPDTLHKAGILEYYDQPVVVTAPDSVHAGQAFDVTIRTYGDGCYSQGETPVAVQGSVAQLSPFDLRSTRGNCPAVVQTFDHHASVTFSALGTAQVVVAGVREPEHTLVTVQRSVVVRP
jgi:hypothetical protein